MLLTGYQTQKSTSSNSQSELQEIPYTTTVLQSRYFPVVLQLINLAVFSFLIYFSWGVKEEALRYTNITSWVVWIVWWPFVIGSTLIAGRLWCTMCHLRLISNWLGKIGLKIEPPKLLRGHSGSVSAVMLIGLLILHSCVISFDVHHIPHYTAIYLIILVIYAAVVSLIFKEGSFCKLFCPLVAFFGPYSLLSPTELRSKNKSKCFNCHDEKTSRSCQNSCPNDIAMQKQVSNDGCLLCFQCVKGCSNNNISLSWRSMNSDLWKRSVNPWPLVLAGIFLLGILFQELGEEWETFEHLILFVPSWLSNQGIQETLFGNYLWLETLWVNILLPFLLFLIAGSVSWSLNRRNSALSYIKTYGIAVIPLVFSAHFSKLINKFNAKIGYVPHLIADPRGYDTAAAIKQGTIQQASFYYLANLNIGWVLMTTVSLGTLASILACVRIAHKTRSKQQSDNLTVASPFAFLYLICGMAFLMVIFHWKIM